MTPAEHKYRALGGPPLSPVAPRPRGLFFPGMTRAVATFALVGGIFTLLIWMKLRVVSGLPRTAYADPNERPQPTREVLPPKRVNAAQESPAMK